MAFFSFTSKIKSKKSSFNTTPCRYNPIDEMHVVSDSLSSKETSLVIEPSKANKSEIYVDLQNTEAVNVNSIIAKGPSLPITEGSENSTDGSCHGNVVKAPIRRLSPEGAECNAVDAQMSDATGDTSGYLTVPDKRVVSVQRRDLSGSPSGRMDVTNYWMWDDVVEGSEIGLITRTFIGQFTL